MIKPSRGLRSAAAAAVLDLRSPARRRRRADRASRSSTSASAPARRCSSQRRGRRARCRASARSAVRSSRSIRRRRRGWSPAASGSRRSSRSPRRSPRAGTPTTLFYGARQRRRAVLRRARSRRSASASCSRPKTAAAASRGRITVPLDAALQRAAARAAGQAVRLRPDADDARRAPQLADAHGRACDVSLEQVMGCGLGGCYSCVVAGARTRRRRRRITRAPASTGPVFDAQRVVWDALAGH